jgi:DNA-binding transcriptional ArsR family regulator
MAGWTFLTNYALVLNFLARDPLITANNLAAQIGVTERAVRRIIADLYEQKYIAKRKEGRRVRFRINSRMPLRHTAQQDISVGELLKVLG